jgi:ribosome maturation factor RimP
MERALAKRIWDLIAPVVEHDGYEVAEVEVHGNRNAVVRIFLDGPEGIGIGKCAEFSRTFSSLLDVEDPIVGAYTLEVGSPGLDRPLRVPKHFQRFIGEEVAVKVPGDVVVGTGKPQKFRGLLREVTDDYFTVSVPGGESRKVAFTELVSAHLIYKLPTPGAKGPRPKTAQH